jgi:hypothetical protein
LFRLSGDWQVAIRSPSPASPCIVSGCAPYATAKSVISTSPRVTIEAFVFSPYPTPSTMPVATAMRFFSTPPNSVPGTSVFTKVRK